jgi:hypothetical protein
MTVQSNRHTILKTGRASLEMLNKGQNWICWIDVGKALVLLRQEAMAEAGTNRPEGSAYNRLFGAKVRDERLDFDKSDRARLFQVMDNLPAIEAWRATLADNERRRFNHPSTVVRRWKGATKVREPGQRRGSSLAEELDAVRAHIAELEATRREESRTVTPAQGSMLDLIAGFVTAKKLALGSSVFNSFDVTTTTIPFTVKEVEESVQWLNSFAKAYRKLEEDRPRCLADRTNLRDGAGSARRGLALHG